MRWPSRWIAPLSIVAVAVAGLIVGLLVIDRAGEAAIARQQTAIARAASDYFVTFAHEDGIGPMTRALNRRERTGSPDGFRYAVTDDMGRTVAGADVLSSLASPDSGWGTAIEPDHRPRRTWRVLTQPIGPHLTLIVAEDLRARDALRASLLRGSMISLLLIAGGLAAVGLVLNSLMFRRARQIAVTAERISGGDLSARAPVAGSGDVFDHIASALNAMLAHIEALMTSLRMVTDSLAHDIRSPLTRLRTALAQASDPDLSAGARLAAIDTAQTEADRALAILSALLDIARAEGGLSRELMRLVDVGALVQEMGELFGPAIEDAGQTLKVRTPPFPAVARIHELLLRQAVGNLLHNASVHAGSGARVVLALDMLDGGIARLTVTDNGQGVAPSDLDRIHERFVRGDRARGQPGAGLGLAIVAACARLHGGALDLTDNAPGLRATMTFPAR